MAAGVLHSDHINYLVLRYLQERGHEAAATALYTEWRRPPEFRDPEALPFASVVRRDELISVIQEGLHHDELSVRVRGQGQRRFQWSGIPGRDEGANAPTVPAATSTEDGRANGPIVENGTAATSRPASAKRKGRPNAVRATEDFPTPAPKRVRRSEGSEPVQVNGDRDGMEVETASAEADAEEDGDIVSPVVASPEPEVVEVQERYDSMDVATQTDVKRGTKTSTMYWQVDKPAASILHSMWNPSSDAKHRRTLLCAGESLCRFYRVPEDMADVKEVFGVEEPSLPANSVVTACTWHPNGRSATCAIDVVRDLPDMAVSRPVLMDYSCDTGSSSRYLDPPLLDPPGFVIALKYNEDGRYLLVARTNETRGLVLIFPTALLGLDNKEPIGWRLFDHRVLDAAWIDDVTFIASGSAKAVHTLTIAEDADPREQQHLGDQLAVQRVEIHGLKDISRNFDDLGVPQWDKLCISPDDMGVAAVCLETRQIARTRTPKFSQSAQGIIGRPVQTSLETLPGHVTALAFQPPANFDGVHGRNAFNRLLAVAMEEGMCAVYGTDRKSDLPALLCMLRLTHSPALTLAWSPRGDYLAVGGLDLVQIWHVEDIHLTQRPVVTWRPDANATRPRNGEREPEDQPISEPSLSWSEDGQSLGFAIDRQIAVIQFRPPLDTNGHHTPGINGHVSP